ncbi:MAG: hypothetical protein COA79_00840 [Planctomycetota bacterium]|nr:MAG: hypothetical protein COA79_00840 [Planctomycetota bacterium]
MNNLKIRTKIILVISMILSTFLASTYITDTYTQKNNKLTNMLMTKTVKHTQHILMMESNIKGSLAALRGWMLLENNDFKLNKKKAWDSIKFLLNQLMLFENAPTLKNNKKGELDFGKTKDLIFLITKNKNLTEKDLVINYDSDSNIKILNILRYYLATLEGIQRTIEEEVHGDFNTPSIHTFFNEFVPITLELDNAFKNIQIDELKRETYEGKEKLLANIGLLRLSFVHLNDDLRAYLITGKISFVKKIDVANKEIKKYREVIKNEKILLSKTSLEQWSTANDLYAYNQEMPSTLIKERSLDEWNLSYDLMKNKAFLINKNIQEIMANLVKVQKIKMEQDVKEVANSSSKLLTIVTRMFYAVVLIGFVLTVFLVRSITKPLKIAEKSINLIAQGDFTIQIPIKSKDEIGLLAASMNIMSKNLNHIFKEIGQVIGTLDLSSTNLSKVSLQINNNSKTAAEKSNNVAIATEDMNSNMASIASTTEESTANIHTMASAIEEMTSTIQEIAINTSRGNDTTINAVGKANEISIKINNLGIATSKINSVVATISNISKQTNLLALNATIEATRAGEAGLGFAVVAKEVKELAQQTNEATVEIRKSIEDIQITTADSISGIKSIVDIINEINEIVSSVASAIEEQSITTQEISKNVSQASSGIKEISDNISLSSITTEKIAKEVSELSVLAQTASSSSSKVNDNSTELSNLAENLNNMVSKFKVD